MVKKVTKPVVKKVGTPKKEEVIELGTDLDILDDIFVEEQVSTPKEVKSSVIELGTPTPERIVVKPKASVKQPEVPSEPVVKEPEHIEVQEIEQSSEPVVNAEIKANPTTPTKQKFSRGQKVFLVNENMKPYIIKKQDPIKPNKWHIQSVYGGLANDIKIVDEKDIYMTFITV